MEEAMNPSSTSSTSSDINGFFEAEDLKDLLGWKLQTGLLDITCGCTSTMGYGDFVASLRITQQGELSVHCNCLPGSCNEGTMTPIKFERHALNDRRKWKESIWVTMFHGSCKYSQKVPLCNTVLLRYYKASRNNGKSMRHVNVHRDEFLRCSACGKERRFKIRNSHEFLVYSLAQKNPNWMCGDEFNCEMEEERASRKMLRGCPKLINCEGCLSCVCTGCDMCLFA